MENQQGQGICKWKSDNGDHQNQRSSDLICKAVKANVSDSQMKKSYFAIDNHMNELQQDEILKNFKINGFFGVELLWRPIAICLYFLKEIGRENFDENQKIMGTEILIQFLENSSTLLFMTSVFCFLVFSPKAILFFTLKLGNKA